VTTPEIGRRSDKLEPRSQGELDPCGNLSIIKRVLFGFLAAFHFARNPQRVRSSILGINSEENIKRNETKKCQKTPTKNNPKEHLETQKNLHFSGFGFS
jgi:hypothetical protein